MVWVVGAGAGGCTRVSAQAPQKARPEAGGSEEVREGQQ